MKTKNIFVDVVTDVQYGDSGKGKITHHLASGKGGKNYTHVMRTSGGNNAGHTIYHNGKKFATHMIPCGVFHGIKSVIGNGCVVNVEKLRKEVKMLEDGGVTVMPLLKIANNAHIITQSHVEEEMSESSVGTTKTGNGPAYRDKYARVGVRAETALVGTEFEACLVDLYEELYGDPLNPIRVLIEGAQGFYLDIDWGDYPYVTSSHCGVGGVMLNGFNHKHIDTVYGSAKCYETYVGAKEFEDKTDPVLPKIREVGGEYGVTCMPAGELILTSKGYINIENAKIGMSVITHNGRVRKITEISAREAEPIYKVTLENGLTLRTNGEHPYLIANKWIKACDLTIGMEATVASNKEEWQQVTKEGFSGYEISSWGRIRITKTKYLLSTSYAGLWGHLKVTLYNSILGKSRKSGGIKDFKVHSLVTEAFIGARPDGMEVRHLNGIPWDNSIQNLVYGTPKENRADAVNHGSMSRRREGAHGGFKTTKLTENDVTEIRNTPRRIVRGWWRKTIPFGISDKTLALKYGVSRETIRDIRLNKCWHPESKTMLPEKTALFFKSKITLIEIEKEQPVFGVTVEEDESHVTGGIVTHNTGRSRQVGYLNIDRLIKACEINGVDTLILNKVDVLRTVNCWKTVRGMDIKSSVVTEHKDEASFKRYVEDRLSSVNVVWSDSPERI